MSNNNRLMNRMNLDAVHRRIAGLRGTLRGAAAGGGLPALAGAALHYEPLEYLLLGATPVVGLMALYRGYKYQHRRIRPSVLFVIGFLLLIGGHFWFPESGS